MAAAAALLAAAARAAPLVGMMYEGWQGPAYWGRGSRGLTVEGVVRSNGSLTLADMRTGWDSSTAMNFYWHKEPLDGFYCIYRKRPNESAVAGLGDCPNITATLTRHAEMLTSVGVDFVVVDSTNIQSAGAAADALQLRPWEVLAEEWLALRRQGRSTPRIAIWQNLQDANGNLWRKYIDGAYADPAYADLIFTDAHTGKKVFFTTANPTPALVTEIEARGAATVTMWALRDNFAKGEWAFESPCTGDGGGFTTSVLPSAPCAQKHTTGSPIGAHGTALTVGPSFQLSYASLPFRAAGKLGGLTLRRQFATAFPLAAAGGLDYLMVGTFNEHIAQPQPNPYAANPAAVSMGLEGDADAGSLWVDMYGDGIARDLEPTKEDGGAMWRLFSSCMRVLRSGAAACGDAAEACCDAADPAALGVPVWSLTSSGGDSLLTADAHERSVLTKQGWDEVCTPFGGADAFCAANNPPAAQYRRGPFLLRAGGGTAVHRCLSAAGRHFASADPACRGDGQAESVLGYAAPGRSTEMPRALRLCGGTGGAYYHNLDGTCDAGDSVLETIGFVH